MGRLALRLGLSTGRRYLPGRYSRVLAPILLLVTTTGVIGIASPAGADTASFSSTTIGTSGSTSSFNQTGPWTIAWSYDCSSAYGATGNFIVNVNGSTVDEGVNELGGGGSGTDYYYDTGTFNFAVISECNWTINVAPGSGAATGTPVTITSAEIGVSGNSQQFSVGGPWTMAWSFDCANTYAGTGNFIADVNGPPGDTSFDVGPNELGTGGSGVDSYTDTGTFTISTISDCPWTITINSSSGASPAPTAPAGFATPVTGIASTPDGGGYWITNSFGGVSPHGDAASYGSLAGHTLNAPITHIVATPDGRGYWLVAADGGTFTFGDARFYGSMGGKKLNAPVVDIAPTADGGGYWLVASDGGIFAFGDARFHGSMGAVRLNKPVVGMAPDFATGGYWLVASDGGIFSFTAPFYGSTGALHLNRPVNGMAATPDDHGYWFVASDGGIFSGGDAAFHGSTGALTLAGPIVGMATDPATGGYWLVGSDGGIFSFAAPFYGAA